MLRWQPEWVISARHLTLGSCEDQVDLSFWLVFVAPPETEREYKISYMRSIKKMGMALCKKKSPKKYFVPGD